MIVEICILVISLIVFIFFVKGKPTEKIPEKTIVEPEPEKTVPKKNPLPTGKSLKKLNQAAKKQDQKDFKHGLLINTLKGHIKAVNDISLSPNGRFVATSDDDRSILLWPTKEFGKGNTSYRHNTSHDPVISVDFAPDSKSLAVVLQKSNVATLFQVSKVDSGYELKSVSEGVDWVPEAALIRVQCGVQFQSGVQSGSYLFHHYCNHTVVLTDLRATQELHRFPGSSGSKGKVLKSPCSRFIIGFGDSSEIRGWAIIFKSGGYSATKKLHAICGHKSTVSQVAFFPDSSKIISLSEGDGEFKIFNLNVDWVRNDTPREQESFPNQWGAVDSLIVSPDNLVIALVQHSSIKFISLRTKVLLLEITDVFYSKIKSASFSPESELFAVAGDRCVRIFKNLAGLSARAHEAKVSLLNPSINELYRKRLLEQLKTDQRTVGQLTALL